MFGVDNDSCNRGLTSTMLWAKQADSMINLNAAAAAMTTLQGTTTDAEVVMALRGATAVAVMATTKTISWSLDLSNYDLEAAGLSFALHWTSSDAASATKDFAPSLLYLGKSPALGTSVVSTAPATACDTAFGTHTGITTQNGWHVTARTALAVISKSSLATFKDRMATLGLKLTYTAGATAMTDWACIGLEVFGVPRYFPTNSPKVYSTDTRLV